MSTTNATSRYSCAHCNGPRTKHGIEGSYCSRDCYHRNEGARLLNNINYDHKLCANCGSQLKEIEKPTDYALRKIQGYHSTTCVVGFEYRTTQAASDETTIVCGNCGNVTLHQSFPETQSTHLLEYAQGIIDALEQKREEGVHDKEIDQREFYEHLVSTEDVPLSLGRAIE